MEVKRNLLIGQDDCAPDSKETFEEEMVKIIGMNIKEFSQAGKKISKFDDTITIEYLYFQLECSADDPFWKLYQIITD